jgi:DNA-binding transcriptional ArsR family regulator
MSCGICYAAAMPVEHPVMSDPRMLRAVAHPIRGRILDELGATGPMRAADIGEALGIPANQASFHLRQLVKYGAIVPAPEAARDKRDRVYRLPEAHGFRIDVQEMEKQPGGKAAVRVFRDSKAAWVHRLVDEAFAFHQEKDTHTTIIQQAMRLTKDEAIEFMREIDEVSERWRSKTRGRSDTRRTYAFYASVQPYPEDAPAK